MMGVVVVVSPLLTPCRVRGTVVMLFRGGLVLVGWFHQSQARGHQDTGHEADREAQTVMRVETNFRQDIPQGNAEKSPGTDTQ